MPSDADTAKSRRAVSAFFFMQGFVYLSWASRIPDIKNHLHLDGDRMGLLFLLLPVSQFLTATGAGYLISRKGSRWGLTLAALLYPALLTAIGAAPSFLLLCLFLPCFSILGNLSNLSVNTQGLGVERLTGKNILSTFHGIWSLGALSGTGLGFLMIQRGVAPLPHFLAVWGLALLVFLTMRGGLLPEDADTAPETGRTRFKPEPVVLFLGLITFCGLVCEGTMVSWTGVYFSGVADAGSRITGLGLTAFMAAMVAGRFTADRLASRLGTLPLIRASALLAAAGLLTIIFSPLPYLSLAGIFLTGLGISSVVPLCYTLTGKSTRLNPGIALSWLSSISFLGLFLGPSTIGFLSERFGLRYAFVLTACLAVGMAALTIPVRRRLGK